MLGDFNRMKTKIPSTRGESFRPVSFSAQSAADSAVKHPNPLIPFFSGWQEVEWADRVFFKKENKVQLCLQVLHVLFDPVIREWGYDEFCNCGVEESDILN